MRGEDLFFFVFCFLFFACHFSKWRKFVLGSTKMENFLSGTKILPREKNQEKWLCPLRNFFLLRPCHGYPIYTNIQITPDYMMISSIFLVISWKQCSLLPNQVWIKYGSGKFHSRTLSTPGLGVSSSCFLIGPNCLLNITNTT